MKIIYKKDLMSMPATLKAIVELYESFGCGEEEMKQRSRAWLGDKEIDPYCWDINKLVCRLKEDAIYNDDIANELVPFIFGDDNNS